VGGTDATVVVDLPFGGGVVIETCCCCAVVVWGILAAVVVGAIVGGEIDVAEEGVALGRAVVCHLC
jgi:hypothetical protein